jgi:peptide/nickel transport system ATP-binding protein
MTASNQPILEYKDFKLSFRTENGTLTAVDRINFKVMPGQIMGLVGESGCGKSVTSLSAMKLLPKVAVYGGAINFQGKNILEASSKELESIRGNKIAMIFQEPMTALNPAFRIGDQLSEVFITHQGMTKEQALSESVVMLKKVGIPSPDARVHEYPHQLSGGMRQRVMIAMALACKPDLLIADEPTTALDVTIQAQILELIKDLQKEFNMAVLFITHDLGVVAEVCDSVTVMYAGRIAEQAPVETLFKEPKHPYTLGLMNSRITLETVATEELSTIQGSVPSIGHWPTGCRFENRCSLKSAECDESLPELEDGGKDHLVACFKAK